MFYLYQGGYVILGMCYLHQGPEGQVLGHGLESQVLGPGHGLEGPVLDPVRDNWVHVNIIAETVGSGW